jgi:hypothetical protein
MDEEAVAKFLTEQKLKSATRRTWGIGSVLVKASTRPVLATMSPQRVTDQIIVSKSRAIVIKEIGEILPSNSLEIMDPSRFSADTATFCALTGQRLPFGTDQLCLVFITVRALSDESSQILLEAFEKGWFQTPINNRIKRLRSAITDRLT